MFYEATDHLQQITDVKVNRWKGKCIDDLIVPTTIPFSFLMLHSFNSAIISFRGLGFFCFQDLSKNVGNRFEEFKRFLCILKAFIFYRLFFFRSTTIFFSGTF